MCGHRRYEYVSRSAERPAGPSSDVRASQAEREHVVDRLRVHTADGRLDLDELEERVGAAYAAKTRRELAALLDDLPEPPPTGSHSRTREVAALATLLPLTLAIGVFVFAPASLAWLGWPILGWWFFGPRVAGRGVASCGSRRARRARNDRTVTV